MNVHVNGELMIEWMTSTNKAQKQIEIHIWPKLKAALKTEMMNFFLQFIQNFELRVFGMLVYRTFLNVPFPVLFCSRLLTLDKTIWFGFVFVLG